MTASDQQFLFEPDEPQPVSIRLAGGSVVIRETRCKSLLNQCSIDDYSFNCYVGCAHGCG